MLSCPVQAEQMQQIECSVALCKCSAPMHTEQYNAQLAYDIDVTTCMLCTLIKCGLIKMCSTNDHDDVWPELRLL